MLLKLILLLTVVPLIEISLILKVHGWVSAHYGSGLGFLITVGTIVVTGVIGANLAKTQGLGVLKSFQNASARGEIPAAAMMDGLMVLVGGALLLTPGYLTDAFGLTLLFPLTRGIYRSTLQVWLERQIKQGTVHTNIHFNGQHHYSGGHETSSANRVSPADVIDVEAEEISK